MPRMTRQQFQLLVAQALAPKLASPVQPYQQPGVGIQAFERAPVGPPMTNPGIYTPPDLTGYGSLLGAIGPSAFAPAPTRKPVLPAIMLNRSAGLRQRPLPKPRGVHLQHRAYQRGQWRPYPTPDYPPY